MNVISAINWLLNMAAFRSLMVGLVACQLGSWVAAPGGGAGLQAGGVRADPLDPQGDGGPL